MNTEELNALRDRAYKTAVEHGFHEDAKPDAFYLGLVMREMGEAINADRKGLRADMESFEEHMANGYSFNDAFYLYIKDSLEDELADIVIRLLDFAGLRGYKPCLVAKAQRTIDSTYAFLKFEESGMPGMFFYLMDFLTAGFGWNELETCIYNIIYILNDCFDNMTGGSDCDLWWFVKMKMRYNELRPKLNGKKY